MRGFAASAVTLLAVWTAAAATVPEAGEDDLDPQARIAHLLDLYETLEEVNLFMDAQPLRCTEGFRRAHVCTWEASAPHEAWMLLAAAWPTEEDVALVCELPADGSPRDPESCTVHPRRSNRGLYRPWGKMHASRWRTYQGKREVAAAKKEFAAKARAELEAARNAAELSRVVGEGPLACTPAGSGRNRCEWRADLSTWGHGTLAMSILARLDQTVRLECLLPADGGDRAPDSCSVVIES